MTISNYTLNAAAIVQLRGIGFKGMPAKVYLGLLATPPKPEGTGYLEVSHPNYCRQLIDMAATGPEERHFRSRNVVEFGPVAADWSTPTHGALFDEEGNLLFYGVFARRAPDIGSYQIRFKLGAVELRTN